MKLLRRISRLLAIPISFLITVFFTQWVLSLFGIQGLDGKAAGAVAGILVAVLVAHTLTSSKP